MREIFPRVMVALIVSGGAAAGWLVSGSLVAALLAALLAVFFVRPGRG